MSTFCTAHWVTAAIWNKLSRTLIKNSIEFCQASDVKICYQDAWDNDKSAPAVIGNG